MRGAPLLLALLLIAPAASVLALPGPPAAPDAGAAQAAAQVAVSRAHAILDGEGKTWIGRSPQGWIDWAKASALHPAVSRGPQVELPAAVEQLYAAAGLHPSDAQLAELRARAARVDPRVAAAFAPLVAAVADGYATQVPIAAQLDWAAVQPGGNGALLPPAAAEASVANAGRTLAAVQAFRQDVAALHLQVAVPTFRDPTGEVILGGTGDDTYEADGLLGAGDPILIADLGGNDVYHTSAGGACPLTLSLNSWSTCNGLALAVTVDLAGDDTYATTGDRLFAQGAGGFGGLGILADFGGNDTYLLDNEVQGGATFPLLGYYVTGVSQGAGEAGVGILLDTSGNDRYQFNLTSHYDDSFAQGQGFGGLGGLGALLDGAGNDVYDTEERCDGESGQFCGLYTQAVALYPGVGLLYDAGGDNRYVGVDVAPIEDYYAQSFAGFGGLSILLDQGVHDTFYASATSRDAGPDLNCAYGTAEYAGASGIFIHDGGAGSTATYYDETVVPAGAGGPSTMAEGGSVASTSLFWDVQGNDRYSSVSLGGNHPIVWGRGWGWTTLETAAVFLDTGGQDTYADIPAAQTIGGDGKIWSGPTEGGIGVDADLLPG